MRSIRFGLLVSLLVTVSCAVNFETLQRQDNVYKLSTEEQLKNENYIEAIENFYKSGKEGYFTGKANIQIYYKIFRQADLENPAILISSGRTEAAIKYKELIFDLYSNGYSVYIQDHRGQGMSGRMTEDPDMEHALHRPWRRPCCQKRSGPLLPLRIWICRPWSSKRR